MAVKDGKIVFAGSKDGALRPKDGSTTVTDLGGKHLMQSFIDGSPQGRTAHFTTPYLTGGPSGETDWKGEPTFPVETINKMVKTVYDAKLPLPKVSFPSMPTLPTTKPQPRSL